MSSSALAGAGYAHRRLLRARQASGLDALRAALADAVSVLVGQSGVGKSSLVGALLPEAEVQTGELVREEEGRHTTTASRAYRLAVRRHAHRLAGRTRLRARDRAARCAGLWGFPEMERLAAACRFQDCRHMQEPDCAVIAAVEVGAMSARRYESYRRLRRRYADLVEARGPGSRNRR